MTQLLLIKHAMPNIDPYRPSREWMLSDAGRKASESLGVTLRGYGVTRMVTSMEPKAASTGLIAAGVLGIPCETASNLHEHDRTGETFDTREDFRAKVAAFFNQPDALVHGRETAAAARARFTAAVDGLLARYPDETLAIAAHGTVITLYVTQYTQDDPFAFWDRLGLPSVVVMDLPDHTVAEVIEEIT